MSKSMHVYRIQEEDCEFVVEAESYDQAIKIWRQNLISNISTFDEPEGINQQTEPELIERMRADAVLPTREWQHQVIQFLSGLQARGGLGNRVHDRIRCLLDGK